MDAGNQMDAGIYVEAMLYSSAVVLPISYSYVQLTIASYKWLSESLIAILSMTIYSYCP